MTEARLFLDVPALSAAAMFEGSFEDACKIVWNWNDVARRHARIEEGDAIYGAGEIERMRPADQGENGQRAGAHRGVERRPFVMSREFFAGVAVGLVAIGAALFVAGALIR